MEQESDCDSYDGKVEDISVESGRDISSLHQKYKLQTHIQTAIWAYKLYNGTK